ncbi:MAG: VanW family protein [Chloroflexota bacterium]
MGNFADTHPNSLKTRPTAPPTVLEQLVAAVLAGSILFATLTLMVMLGFQLLYIGRIYPGVQVAGIDIGGLTRQAATEKLIAEGQYPHTGLIALEDQGTVWVFSPIELGLVIDEDGSAEAAFQIGRRGWPWTRWDSRIKSLRYGSQLAPQLILDQRLTQAQLNLIAGQINQPMIEASLQMDGNQVVAQAGQVGRLLDIEATIQQIQLPASSMQDASLSLVVDESHPTILDVSAEKQIAEQILSEPLIVRVSGSSQETLGPWTFERETLASMLIIERAETEAGEAFVVRLDENKLYNFIYPFAPSLQVIAKNARFIFNDDTRQLDLIEAGAVGRDLMVSESISLINEMLRSGVHSVDLVFDYTNPEISDDLTAAELQITELVSSNTSYFYGSDSSRIQNIKTAAAQFHGIFIAPGETFSMVENIGDISVDTGYAEAWIIYGDRTVKGVGGGVCQVSTTLFRTAFFGGFPIEERHPHAYRVYYYELTSGGSVNADLAGLDATVYAPVVDFKFTNDTPYWLLMETYVNEGGRSLTWKFYSTSDGRTVDWDTTGLTNKKQPPWPVYEENKDLDKGEIKKVDWAVEGAQVTINRTVWRDGSKIIEDTFRTTYTPWAAVCQYGPGTKDYPPTGSDRDRFSCRPKKDD